MAETMCEMNQEPEYEVPSQEEEEEDDDLQLQEPINFSNLHHDSFKNNHQIQNRHPCTPCACNVTAASNPMKRPSPEQISEPKSKKPSLDLSGFSKLPLPQLQRSVSDPFTPTKANVSEYAKGLEDTPLSKGSASSSALPPKAPVLSRTRSEPIVSPVKSVARSSISNDLGIESIKEESHSAKRLKRMKQRMKEMYQWWDEAMRDDEDVGTTETTKDDDEEAVQVEKIGECLDLHFKCPCGKGYKILLSGKNCYYKLI